MTNHQKSISKDIIGRGWVKDQLASVLFFEQMKMDKEYSVLFMGERVIMRKSPLNNIWIYKKKVGKIV